VIGVVPPPRTDRACRVHSLGAQSAGVDPAADTLDDTTES